MSLTPTLQALTISRLHRMVICWKITRKKDGVVIRLTDHNRSLMIDGFEYSPVDAISASARQKQEDLASQNLNVIGVISSDLITETDIAAGFYREAKVEEFVVDWRFPFAGKFIQRVYWIQEMSRTSETWEAQVSGFVARLSQRVGDVYARPCRFKFCQAGTCDVVEADITVSGTIAELIDPRRAFKTNLSFSDGKFDDGKITFTSGDTIKNNQVFPNDVRVSLAVDGYIELAVNLPFNAQVGDQFDIVPGCPHTIAGCKSFNNFPNYGGFPTIPGTDAAFETPNAKMS